MWNRKKHFACGWRIIPDNTDSMDKIATVKTSVNFTGVLLYIIQPFSLAEEALTNGRKCGKLRNNENKGCEQNQYVKAASSESRGR